MEEKGNIIDERIIDYLTGSIGDEDSQQLERWVNESDENRQYFLHRREIWCSSVNNKLNTQYNFHRAFAAFKKRIDKSQPHKHSVIRSKWFVFARYAAVIAIMVLIGQIAYQSGEANVKKSFADIQIEAPLGSRSKLYLPDGTMVWLNAGSRLSYSQGFGVDDRRIILEGEAYFEVMRDEKLPFYVSSDHLQLQVLGTKFNFRDYPDDQEVTVSLLEGSVKLDNLLQTDQHIQLTSNQRSILNKESGSMKMEAVTASNATQWTEGFLYFDEELISDIAKELERSYNVQITITNDSLKDFRFYGIFTPQEQTIQEVLDILAITEKIHYSMKGREITIY